MTGEESGLQGYLRHKEVRGEGWRVGSERWWVTGKESGLQGFLRHKEVRGEGRRVRIE